MNPIGRRVNGLCHRLDVPGFVAEQAMADALDAGKGGQVPIEVHQAREPRRQDRTNGKIGDMADALDDGFVRSSLDLCAAPTNEGASNEQKDQKSQDWDHHNQKEPRQRGRWPPVGGNRAQRHQLDGELHEVENDWPPPEQVTHQLYLRSSAGLRGPESVGQHGCFVGQNGWLPGWRPPAGALLAVPTGSIPRRYRGAMIPEKYRRPTINTTAEAPATRTTTAWEILSAAGSAGMVPLSSPRRVADFTQSG